MKLDEKLVLLRKEKGLTQLELAEAVYVSRQAVSKWESGGTVPSMENLLCLGKLYGVSVDYLLNEGEDREDSHSEAAGDGRGAACGDTDPSGEGIARKIGWQNYVISILLALCFIAGIFQLKLMLGHNVSILMSTVCVGAIAGLFICGALLALRRRMELLVFSMILSIIWLMAPGDRTISPAVFSAGAVGLLGSVPVVASVLSRGLQKQGGRE